MLNAIINVRLFKHNKVEYILYIGEIGKRGRFANKLSIFFLSFFRGEISPPKIYHLSAKTCRTA